MDEDEKLIIKSMWPNCNNSNDVTLLVLVISILFH